MTRYRSNLTELCWDCHETLEPDTAVTVEVGWPGTSTTRVCRSCAGRRAAPTRPEETTE